MTEEDEAFNEIERRSKAKQEAVRAAMQAEHIADCPKCEYNKTRAARWRAEAYKQAGHDVIELPWVGLTDDEVELYWDWEDFQCGAGRSTVLDMVRDIESKLKLRNT